MSIKKNFKAGDKVITTHGNVGDVEVVYQDAEIYDADFQDCIIDTTSQPFVDEHGNRVWSFINEKNEKILLIENAHFKLKKKYQVRFDKNTKILNRESLRLLDKPYIVITVEDSNKHLKSFIKCNNHKPIEGVYKDCKLVMPFNQNGENI